MKIELALPLLSALLMRSNMHCNLYHSVECLAYFRDLRFVLVPTYLYKTLMASLRFSPVSFRCSYTLEAGENETDWQTQLLGVCICRHSVSSHKFETQPSNVAITWTSKGNFSKWPTRRTILLFYNTFITVLYMFPATSCSSSGGQIVLIQHLVWPLSVSGRPVAPNGHLQRVTIPDAVLIKSDLLIMSTTLFETCRGL